MTSNGHDLDVSRIAHDGEKRLATGHDVNLGSGTSKADKRKSLPAEGCCSNLCGGQSVCCRASSFARFASTEHKSELLVWPGTPKHKP